MPSKRVPKYRKCQADGCEVMMRLRTGFPKKYCPKHDKEFNEVGIFRGSKARTRIRRCPICQKVFKTRNGSKLTCGAKCEHILDLDLSMRRQRGEFVIDKYDRAEHLVAWEDYGSKPDESLHSVALAGLSTPQFERTITQVLSGKLKLYR